MSLSAATIRKNDQILREAGCPVPPGYWDLSIETKMECCNGIGTDSGNLKYLVAPTSFVFKWMLPLSQPHDIWWSVLHNDGSRELFERSNQEFKEGGYLLAQRSFGWVWPKGLRDTLRNGRKFEAREARNILMSDMCWDVWAKCVVADEGPEVSE